MVDQVTLEDMPQSLRDAYQEVAPHPENLQSFFDKGTQRMRDFKDIPEGSLRGIGSPALVIVGDRDFVRPEHALETQRLIANSQLAILPDTRQQSLMIQAE